MKLGEISINKEAFELDLKINEGYRNYSAELLRLPLLILTGLSAVWLKLYLPIPHANPLPLVSGLSFVLSFALTAAAAGAALIHRYIATDSLAYHLSALRLRARNRPAEDGRSSDSELAECEDNKRNRRFKWSRVVLSVSAASLFLGLVLFCVSLGSLMFRMPTTQAGPQSGAAGQAAGK